MTILTFCFCCSTMFAAWHSWRWKEQMGTRGHQLWPISQVTTLTIVTSRFKPHVYIPRSCSGSAGSCPFTFTPTNELGAKHDVITPIWLRTSRRTGKWSAVSCACLPRQGSPSEGHDLPLPTPQRLLDDQDTFVVDKFVCFAQLWFYLLSCIFISSNNNLKVQTRSISIFEHQLKR